MYRGNGLDNEIKMWNQLDKEKAGWCLIIPVKGDISA